MKIEHQIDIEYADGNRSKHLLYNFDSAELRNTVYQNICSEFANNKVDMNYLRTHGGVTVSTYNYSEPFRGEIAQIVSHNTFRIEVLEKILSIIEKN